MTAKTKRLVTILVAVGAVAIIIAGAIIGPKKWREREQRKMTDKVRLAFAREEYQRAEELLKELLVSLPDNPGVTIRLSEVCIKLKKFDEAREWADKAAAVRPDEPFFGIQKASTYRHEATDALAKLDAAPDPAQFDRVAQLCDQADALLDQVGKTTAADPRIQAERGRVLVLRADAAHRRSNVHQGQADQARAAGRADDARTQQQQADKWRTKSDEHRAAGIKELASAFKLSPKDMGLAQTYAEACFRAERWSEVVVAYRTATTVAYPTPKTVVLAARAVLSAAGGKTKSARVQACQLAREMLNQAAKKSPFNIDIKLESAAVELEAGDLNAAERLLDKVSNLARPSPESTLLRAKLLLKRDRPQEARKLLHQLHGAQPDRVEVKTVLAQAEGRCGQAKRSLTLLRQVVALDPDDAGARLRLARALAGRGLWDGAAELLAAGLRRDPINMSLVRAAATMAVRYGHPDRADALIRQAERAGDRTRIPLRDLALFCLRLGRADWMKRIVTESLKSDSKSPVAQFAGAAANVGGGKADEAIKVLEPLVMRRNPSPEVYLLLADAYGVLGRTYDADDQLKKALVAGENDYLTALCVAQRYGSLGMLTQATELNGQLLREDPEAPATLWQGVRLALLGGELPRATELLGVLGAVGWRASTPLERAVEHLLAGRYERGLAEGAGQGDPVAPFVAHWALAKLGRQDQAARRLEAAIKANPKRITPYLRMAAYYVAIGKAKQGTDRLSALAASSPPNVALGIGRIYWLTGQYDQALKTYEAALADETLKLDKQTEGDLRLGVAACFERQRRSKEEMAVYREMQKDSALSLRGLEASVNLLVRARQFKQVADLMDAYLRPPNVEKLSADLLTRMARVYARIGQVNKAAAVCDRVARLLPGAIWVWRARAELYRNAGRTDEAIKLYHQALAQWPADRGLLRDLAHTYVQAAGFPQAFETLATIAPPERAGAGLAERDRALLMSKLGLYERGRIGLEKVLSKPTTLDFESRSALARCLAGQGKIDEAIEQLSAISPTSELYPGAWIFAAHLEQDRGRSKQAMDILSQAADKAPDSGRLAWARFNMMLRAGQVDQAVKMARRRAAGLAADRVQWAPAAGDVVVLQSAWEEQPGNRALAVRLGLCLLTEGKWKVLQEVLAPLKPTTTAASTQPAPRPAPGQECLLALAELADGKQAAGAARLDALLEGQKPSQAWRTVAAVGRMGADKPVQIARLRKSVRAGTEQVLIDELAKRAKTAAGKQACRWVAASMAARLLRMPTLSYRLAEAGVKSDGDSAGAHFVRLASLWAMDAAQSDKAKKLAGELVKRFGGSRLAKEVSVRQMLTRGDYDQAVAALKAWEQTGGVPARLAGEVGNAALAKGKKADALRWFERCLKQNPDDAPAANNVAWLLAELRGQDAAAMDRAEKLAERVLRRSGWRPSVSETLGWILVKRGRPKDGLALLQRAIVPLADDVRVHYHLAVAYEKTGAVEMARLHYEHVAAASKDKALANEARKALKRLPKQAPTTTTARAA